MNHAEHTAATAFPGSALRDPRSSVTMRFAISIVVAIALPALAGAVDATAASRPSGRVHQRHKDFGQRAVHLFGAFDGWELTRSDSFRQQISVESATLLKGFGQFPPTDRALANPKMIEDW